MLTESARRERDRDSVSCSIRFLWRQHVEVRLRQAIVLGSFLLYDELEGSPPGSLEALWPRARQLLVEVGWGPSPELEAAEQALRHLRTPSLAPEPPPPAGGEERLPDSITVLIRFLESAVQRLDREAQRKLAVGRRA